MNDNDMNTNNIEFNPLVKETIECLNKTFTEKNNAERLKAEKRLRELGIA
jgi:hypothetical protein